MVSAKEDLTAVEEAKHQAQPLYSSRMPILGNDVLRGWMKRVRTLGVENLWLTSAPAGGREASFAIADFVRQGVERLLVIKLKAYAEMDLGDFVQFHRQRKNTITEVQDGRGLLGVSLLDRSALVTGEGLGSWKDAEGNAYEFGGYAKRILSARERQELVRDALTGACSMRPRGKEIREQVWIGEGAEIADSARIIGPTYIGERTVIRAGATIGPFASVERDCVVDCGTTVECSTVLPFSYLAPGLAIQHKSVDGRYLVDLAGGEAGGEVADLQPAGLGRRIAPNRKPRWEWHKMQSQAQADGNAAWTFAPFTTASQPWLQVQM